MVAESTITNHVLNFIVLFQPGGAQGFKSKENIFSSQQFVTKEAKQHSTDFSAQKQSRGVFWHRYPLTGGDRAGVLVQPCAKRAAPCLVGGFGQCSVEKHQDLTSPAKFSQSDAERPAPSHTCQARSTFSPLAKPGATVPTQIRHFPTTATRFQLKPSLQALVLAWPEVGEHRPC